MTIVTENGEILKIAKDSAEHHDLFWACCGAGCGNFGVVTDLTLKTYPADDVSIFRYSFEWNDKIADISAAWSNMIKNESPDLMSFFRFKIINRKPILNVFGQYYGSQKVLEKMTAKYFDQFKITEPTLFSTLTNIDAVRYWGGIKKIQNHSSLLSSEDKIDHIHDPHHYATTTLSNTLQSQSLPESSSFITSSIMAERPLNASEIEAIKTSFEQDKTSQISFVVLDSHFNGKSSHLPEDHNAYAHRGAFASIQIYKIWNQPENKELAKEWVLNLHQKLQGAGSGTYCNYPGTIENPQQAYYRQHYSKLQQIKKKYDPNNCFTYSQAIEMPK